MDDENEEGDTREGEEDGSDTRGGRSAADDEEAHEGDSGSGGCCPRLHVASGRRHRRSDGGIEIAPVVIATKGKGKSAATLEGERVANWLRGCAAHYAAGNTRPYFLREKAWNWPVEHAIKAAHLGNLELAAE